MRKADNLPSSCAVVTKSGNLNFLEPSGPLQACNATDLPFTFDFHRNNQKSVVSLNIFGHFPALANVSLEIWWHTIWRRGRDWLLANGEWSAICLFNIRSKYVFNNTYLLTPWSRVLLEKPTGFQLVKKFPALYGTWMFITAFTSARHMFCLPSINPIPRLSVWTFRKRIRFYGELFAPRPSPPMLVDYPLSAVCDCLFDVFLSTLHIGGRSSIRSHKTRHAPWWQWPAYHGYSVKCSQILWRR